MLWPSHQLITAPSHTAAGFTPLDTPVSLKQGSWLLQMGKAGTKPDGYFVCVKKRHVQKSYVHWSKTVSPDTDCSS